MSIKGTCTGTCRISITTQRFPLIFQLISDWWKLVEETSSQGKLMVVNASVHSKVVGVTTPPHSLTYEGILYFFYNQSCFNEYAS